MSVVFPFMEKEKREFVVKKREKFFTTFFESTYYIDTQASTESWAQMRIELTAIKGAASHSHLDVISSIWRHLENEAKASQNINTNFLAITYTHRHIIQKNWISVLIFVSSYEKQHSLDKSKKLFSHFQPRKLCVFLCLCWIQIFVVSESSNRKSKIAE